MFLEEKDEYSWLSINHKYSGPTFFHCAVFGRCLQGWTKPWCHSCFTGVGESESSPRCWDEVAQPPFSFWGGDTLWWLLYPVKTAVWFDSSKTFLFYFCLKWFWMQSKRCFSDWTGFVDIRTGGWRECRDKHTAAELCKWAVVTLSCSSSSVI